MSQTTPDVAQLSHCCAKRLQWTPSIDASGNIDGYAGRCSCGAVWEELSAPARLLLPTEQLLLARAAELEATLANERGEGEAPVKGWAYFGRMERWQAPHGVVARLTSGQMANAGWKAPYAWERWDTPEVQRGCADSFRAAMRAASGAS